MPGAEALPPLDGVVVIDLSTTLAGAQASQFLADCGAEVIFVEPADGSPLRQLRGWPALLRNKRSITLDIRNDVGQERLWSLLESADVLVTTMRPAAAERLGLTPDQITRRCPQLVAASITGWGSTGPFRDYKGWSALVDAKIGVMRSKQGLLSPPRPAFCSAPYSAWGAQQAAVQAILAALIERENSGVGQVVESNLVTGIGAMDPYNWFYETVVERYPDAYLPMDTVFDDEGRPQIYLLYALLTAPTSDNKWLQFAQVSPRLMQAWLTELDLLEELANPKWQGFPMLPTAELRTQWWDIMIERVGRRSLDEWQQAFDNNRDLGGELFRSPAESLDHPQTVYENRVVTVDDPKIGPVRQVSTLIHSGTKPLRQPGRAPGIGEHSDTPLPKRRECNTTGTPTVGLPLAGITILEFGTMFAGPYGATILTDLGARVIKVEPLEGDHIRQLLAFPEAGGAKVLQGKESVAIDFTQPEGLEVVYKLVAMSDVALLCFRGGAAERAKIDEDSLRKIKPDIVVLHAPGYGTEGPFAHRAAYAPSIGAASGLAQVDSRGAAAPPRDIEDIHRRAATLFAAGAVSTVQADGIAALGVASALLVGIYAQKRGITIPNMAATMLGSSQQALINLNTTYPGAPTEAVVNDDFTGLNALYRAYPASDGWVFLAAPQPEEWPVLAKALSQYADIGGDERFATAELRGQHDADLAELLAAIFATKPKLEWERELTGQDVGCVEVAQSIPERLLQSDTYFDAGYAVEADSPIFGHHRRLAPLARFSRSATKADGGCTIGQHTDAVLREVGLSDEDIATLRLKSIVGSP